MKTEALARLIAWAGLVAATGMIVGATGLARPEAALARSKPGLAGCRTFMRDFAAALGDLRVEFSRTLVVGRGRRGDLFNLVSEQEVDGTLECTGDEFVRLELRIAVPANARTQSHFDRFQPAALKAALKWDNVRTASLLARLTSDVAEYLRGSEQRGDVYVSGHDERHLSDGTVIGLFWTPTDHSFIISSAAD
jgi:hypothetical protein